MESTFQRLLKSRTHTFWNSPHSPVPKSLWVSPRACKGLSLDLGWGLSAVSPQGSMTQRLQAWPRPGKALLLEREPHHLLEEPAARSGVARPRVPQLSVHRWGRPWRLDHPETTDSRFSRGSMEWLPLLSVGQGRRLGARWGGRRIQRVLYLLWEGLPRGQSRQVLATPGCQGSWEGSSRCHLRWVASNDSGLNLNKEHSGVSSETQVRGQALARTAEL